MSIKSNLIPIVLVVVLSFFSYITIFDNEFVWDDHVFILENPDIKSFSNVPLFFMQDVDGLYRPLRTLQYTFMYKISGTNPSWYHVHGLLLHILITILVYFIITEIAQKRTISLIAALLFAAHPIHTGRVTNITASFDLAGIFFLLLAFFLYIKYAQLKNKKYFFVSLVSFIVALFFSEEAITFPLLVVLHEFCFNRGSWKKKSTIKSYSFLFGISAAYLVLRFFVLGIAGRTETYIGGTFLSTMLTMLKVYVYYIYLLFVPVNLTLFHDVDVVSSFLDLKMIFAFLFLLALLFIVVRFYNKIVFFSIGWFFITLLPMSNIVPLQVFMAERYLYVPSVGFSLLIAYGLYRLYNAKIWKSKKTATAIAASIMILLLGFYVFQTIDRNADWQDNMTLWTETVRTNPDSSRAHDNLGFTYERAGDIGKAVQEFETAVTLQPDNFRALANLGVAYAQLGRYNESIAALELSLTVRPYHKTYDKLGLVYVELQQEALAIAAFEKAIKLNYRYPKAHNDLGTVYGRIGRFDDAINAFNDALIIDKTYADAHYNLGIILEFLGEEEIAQEEFLIAYQLEPGNALYREKV